jgi:integrase
METSELIRLHRLAMKRRHLSEGSIDKRISALRRLAEHLAPAGLLEPSSEDIESYLDTLPLQARSRYTYLSHLHCFYGWAIDNGHAGSDPTLQIVRPKCPPGQPRPIGDVDLKLALELAAPPAAVILACAAYAGMRCCEIARLSRGDIDTAGEGHIWAHGKGGKSRQIPLHPALAQALAAHGIPRTGPLLRRADGRPMPAWLVSQTANAYLHGLSIDATAHQLRHWFGTNLYRTSRHNLLLVRDLMGHANITTTTIYAASDREGAHQAVAAMRPGLAAAS